MGIYLSCPFATYNNLESGLESIVVKPLSLEDDEAKTPKQSFSFKTKHNSESMLLSKSLASGRMNAEGSVGFKQTEIETLISIKEDDTVLKSVNLNGTASPQSGTLDLASPKHEAAVKLQKVYKSFRTRRKLADCAVLVEQSWWKLLDFAELKHSSISFFDIEHHETAISRWSRAKTRAAKVGKGLSKNGKAQKLALQHWLEAIDPRHRYGHNLHFYYVKWLESQSKEPFFYWLDIGEGKEVNLVVKCPRCKLQQQCIRYLGPMERKAYEVTVECGKFFYEESGELLDTSANHHAKWIFVLSTSKTLYVGQKKKGTFQHSSFLAGGATSAAGRLVVKNGILKAVWPHSGHYRPTPENFQEFISFLGENDVDLTEVQMDPEDEDEQLVGKSRSKFHMRNNSSEEDLMPGDAVENNGSNRDNIEEKPDLLLEQKVALVKDYSSSSLSRKLAHLQIPRRDDLVARMQMESLASENVYKNSVAEAALTSEQDVQVRKANEEHDEEGQEIIPAEEENDEEVEEIIPAESILKRINSHKEAKSYQLAKQLSCRWTTGAGPRIGCVRDYPSELQFRALEQVNLSPRSVGAQMLTPSCVGKSSPIASSTPIRVKSCRNKGQCRPQSSPLSKLTKPAF